MSQLGGVIEVPWTRQPHRVVGVNRDNPLARDIIWLADHSVGAAGGMARTHLPVSSITSSGTVGISFSQAGRGTRNDNTSYWYYDSFIDRNLITYGFTSLLLVTYTGRASADSNFMAADCDPSGGGYNWGHYLTGATSQGTFYVRNGSGVALSAAGPSGIQPGFHVFGGSYDQQNIRVSVDGSCHSPQAHSGTVNTTVYKISYNRWQVLSKIGMVVHAHIILNRGLSESELSEVTRNPWQLFAP